eukprot:UN03223
MTSSFVPPYSLLHTFIRGCKGTITVSTSGSILESVRSFMICNIIFQPRSLKVSVEFTFFSKKVRSLINGTTQKQQLTN